MNEETRWQDQFEDPEISDSAALQAFKSPKDAIKGYLELKSWQGRAVSLPGDDPQEIAKFVAKTRERVPNLTVLPDEDNPDDVKRFWGDLGVPEDINGYKPPADAGVLDEELDKQIKDIAHKANMTDKQYQAFRQSYVEGSEELAETNAKMRAEQDAKLKQHWGAAHDENMQITDAMVKQFQDKDVPLGELNVAARVFLMNVAKSLGNDPQIFDQINKPKPAKTPADIRADQDRYRKQLTDKSKPLNGQVRKDILKKYNQTFIDLEPYS
jgi:hypothetical protein